jgi:uncharacterized membrane protein YqiK
VQGVEREKAIEIANQDKRIVVAAKSEEQSHAQAKANAALAENVKAEQAVETARATATADREKEIALINASREAEQKAIAVRVAAEAEKDAANNRASAVKIKAEADRVAFEVEATGKRLINEAINVLSSDQISLQIKLALLQSLPAIIEKSVEPMKRIDGIKIVQVDGLTRPGNSTNGSGDVPGGHGSLAEQAVAAALAYRAQSPIIDGLLKEIGMTGSSLGGLAQAAAPEQAPPLPARKQQQTRVDLDKLEDNLMPPPRPMVP